MQPDFIESLGQGIYAIDTGFQRPRFDAAYLMVENGRAAFIDTGTNHAVPRLLAALDALGLAPSAVDWVIPTHVHLDHAGGAGLLMQSLPQAKLLVHPRGLRHMIDPSALYQGALAVYGQEEMQRSYGELQPVPAERAQASVDEQTIELAGRPLLLIDTPGHARHHHCIWDARSRGWFTGDTFGLSYREFDTSAGEWLLPTSTPVQFDPQSLRASVERLMSFDPQAMYLTHFGRIGFNKQDLPRLAALLLAQVDEMVALGLKLRDAAERHRQLMDGLRAIYLRSLQEHGCQLPEQQLTALLSMDIELNAQGLAVWLDKPKA
ncbi:MBL fold metallo-hydrolase [Roseateles oligotrophus]|uniref:MBL fold metallo-hydrolase n=1 Tax=Roseateles oligotrophus TaxID=1769250 RepID=A0ABT2YJE3_9BURK|nr:MBL fold metallo-hydrolase [Roseateles oligotrophus]MCV2370172.1 MBL fold metallo-hydrolase [Roseateles oligotrophus]